MSSPGFEPQPLPFAAFTEPRPQSGLRAAITAAYRRPETDCLPPLLQQASLTTGERERVTAIATDLVHAARAHAREGAVQSLLHEYSLSSEEGIALMCLAEALLRIPDSATRDRLIRDKIGRGDWRSHAGHSDSFFVNAATWGLIVTGRLTAAGATGAGAQRGLGAALTTLLAKGGEPLIRKGVEMAMRVMGDQFVTGQTIDAALANSAAMNARGFRHSYDMLGEAALTAADAARYFTDYETAIHAIGRAAAGGGPYAGPGISVKLSALHPRYSRAQLGRVRCELLPRLQQLARLAARYDIALNVDAEEADRLDLSLDLLEALCLDPTLQSWQGIGFVVQAYSKRCRAVIDWLIELAHRSRHRLMVRLVKGAYWDAEIKRAQLDGLADFPVFTRKVHTDVCYLACARALLAAPVAVFPQFATHNAHTLAAVMVIAERCGAVGAHAEQYEFQCLHGMGETLYGEVVGAHRFDRACRIYAPVGTHDTLLAYLVRRLLENGANTSFVNRMADAAVPIETLIEDPVVAARRIAPPGEPHRAIAHPRRLFGAERVNSAGFDFSDEDSLSSLAERLCAGSATPWSAAPPDHLAGSGRVARSVHNPADHRDRVGSVTDATLEDVRGACTVAHACAPRWAATPAHHRATLLETAANLFERRLADHAGLIIREAGKSAANAVAETREAVDFLRYYAVQARCLVDRAPLGPVACISPWNFPLAIFIGQVAAALAAGNTVLAKPAEETPLTAALGVRVLHEAGIPPDVLQLLPGGGEVGAALVADPRVCGVVFTGSTDVARAIQRELARRLSPYGSVVPLIAETGGQNAMIVDSSALVEQVVGDVVASAFDSAGQRCSALRVLCVQEDVAERTLEMLRGAIDELRVGNPDRLATDVGPVIHAQARDSILAHVEAMRARGHRVHRAALPPEAAHGTFVAPTVIEIARIADVTREVFGPVLHVLRYPPAELERVIEAINATGYGLTFGLHTRLDDTVARVTERIAAGNVYVNRNVIGAVVGVQPFGGHGLSGTGPKAGGPLYVPRLTRPPPAVSGAAAPISRLESVELAGPVGERNTYRTVPRGRIVAFAGERDAALAQLRLILDAGNTALLQRSHPAAAVLDSLAPEQAQRVELVDEWAQASGIDGLLFAGDRAELLRVNAAIAARAGPIVLVQDAALDGSRGYDPNLLVKEISTSINTAAAGGNASLMTLNAGGD